MQNFGDFTFDNALAELGRLVDALIITDQETDTYKALVLKGVFRKIISETGTYKDIVQKLWFHFYNSDKTITEEYLVFIPNLSKFVGKYSKRIKLVVDGVTHIIQMTIHPIKGTSYYLFVLDELDESECEEDAETQQKVSTIQNIYLFSMCFDLVRDTTSSLSLTEVSNETMNSQISYSAWRQMIVNMIWEEDKPTFMERSDPEYLRAHFKPGQMESFDCQMQNLEGVYIWVKLIFSRMETTNENDYRFVYMVQNIHDTTVSMKATLKHYEELASRDPLTKIFNHGRIETELCNAVEKHKEDSGAVSLMIIDIDHFKEVNDSYGHAAGDQTLVRFAELMRRALSGHSSVYGRWGGEEFVVVIYGAVEEELRILADHLRSSVENEKFEGVGAVTCSIGAAVLEENDTFETWFDRADNAVYTAKSNGRNCIHIA